MAKFISIINQVFGRLTVIKREANDKSNRVRWLCQCDCGTQTCVTANNLRRGIIKSCGCLRKEMSAEHCKSLNFKHGLAKSSEYQSWFDMVRRCENPDNISYPYYGAMGIEVCSQWHDFLQFLKDMGLKPSPDFQVERIDHKGSYSPMNCRWATQLEQARNKSNNVILIHNNERRCLSEWASIYNINPRTLHDRLNKLGWSIERALTEPVRKRCRI